MRLTEVDGKPDHLLRVGRVSGSSDVDLLLALVANAEPDDEVGESNGVHLCVAGDVSSSLDGKLLDFQQSSGGRGLVMRSS